MTFSSHMHVTTPEGAEWDAASQDFAKHKKQQNVQYKIGAPPLFPDTHQQKRRHKQIKGRLLKVIVLTSTDKCYTRGVKNNSMKWISGARLMTLV